MSRKEKFMESRGQGNKRSWRVEVKEINANVN